MERMARPLSVFDVGSEDMPDGWYDEIVIHTIRRNKDGSVTAICHVNLYDGKGGVYSAERTIRLTKRD